MGYVVSFHEVRGLTNGTGCGTMQSRIFYAIEGELAQCTL